MGRLKFLNPNQFSPPAQRLFLMTALAVCLLVSLVIFNEISDLEDKRLEDEFKRIAQQQVQIIIERFNDYQQAVKSTGYYFINSEEVTRKEFREFSKSILESYPGMGAVSWNLRISNNQRPLYEEAGKQDGFVEFQFTERDISGKLIRAAERSEYIIVYYIEPLNGNQSALGYDIASNHKRLETIQKARDTGNVAITERINLVQDKENHAGILILYPIYKSGVSLVTQEDRRSYLEGFSVGVVRIGDVFKKSLQKDNKGLLDIYLYDITNKNEVQLLYSPQSRNGTEQKNKQHLDSKYSWMTELEVGGRQWKINITSTPAYESSPLHLQPLVMLVLMILLTFFLLMLIQNSFYYTKNLNNEIAERKQAEFELQQYKTNLEELVQKRTEELNSVNQNLKTEIAEHKKAEDALRKSDDRLKTIFNEAPMGIALIDSLTGQIVELNPRYAEIAGRDIEELTKIDRISITHPDDVQKDLDNMSRLIAGEIDGFKMEKRYILPDESVIWINLTVTSLKEDDSTQHQHLAMIEDITERKASDAVREKLQSQLDHAQKMEAVGRLAGGVAHDFNNMLGVILGHAELILNEMTPGQPHVEDIEAISAAAQRSADLTRQLLAFARKQIISPKELDINWVVGDMINMLKRLIGEDINLDWLPGKHLWVVQMDPGQLDQILANLCVNARDAITGIGKIAIQTENISIDKTYCSSHAEFKPGEFVVLSVSDSGCGMDTETLKSIFEPFYTTKGMNEGTGLGLATVYGIVSQNNGFINVYSEPGFGTTFKIYLPRYKGEVEETEKITHSDVVCGNETILLVEDEPALLHMTTRILEEAGYTILGAGTPNEAIHLATEHSQKIDLLMTDVVMPEMNGRDLASHILSICPGIKTLFMSGYTANVIAHHGILDEGVDFIQKPFKVHDLAIKLHGLLRDDQV